ncbi:MAG TPA: hypothetical protein VFP87_05780, partial [Chitinophagaceae bacterium]|nr:hypothetical protein [Chitinophagaceae bacterium]
YAFELKVTDDGGLSAIGTLLVTVDSISMTNHPPVPNAGADQILTLGAGNWFAWDFGGDYSSTINIYDATADSWSTSTLTEARGAMAAIAVGNKNYWAGGLNELGQTTYLPVSTGEIMDMSTGSVTHECLFQPNSGFTAVQKSSRILFSTTHSTQSGWLIPGIVTNKLDIYDPANDSWSIGVLPVNIYDASIISVNNTVYVAGGIVNGALSNQVWTLEF